MKHSTREKTGYCGGSGSERRESRTIQGIHDDPIPQETDPDSGLLIGPQLASPGPARVPERMVLEGRSTLLSIATISTPLRRRRIGPQAFAICPTRHRSRPGRSTLDWPA